MEKAVEPASYPRRNQFAPPADTGSACRRYGFGPSQNRVRLPAESGSAGLVFPLRIKALNFTYTVYK